MWHQLEAVLGLFTKADVQVYVQRRAAHPDGHGDLLCYLGFTTPAVCLLRMWERRESVGEEARAMLRRLQEDTLLKEEISALAAAVGGHAAPADLLQALRKREGLIQILQQRLDAALDTPSQ